MPDPGIAGAGGGGDSRLGRSGRSRSDRHGDPDPGIAEEAIEAALGVQLRDRALLDLALIHRSHAFEAGGLPTNERLEFLGDAVLGLVVTDWLYAHLPDASEGRLAKIRAAVVNTQRLAQVARTLGVGDSVRLGKGEEQSGGRDKDSILADTLEALLGAVYLDRGLAAATSLIDRLFTPLLRDIANSRESLDYKTSLQELTASALSSLPVYQLTEEGPDHNKRFTALAVIDGEILGSGTGRSKKEAEQVAAKEAYRALRARVLTEDGGRDAVSSGPHDGSRENAPALEERGVHEHGGRQ